MENREKFLDKYKKLENILTKWQSGMSVRDFEEEILDQETRNKLYTCRVIRNYLQHNADIDFIEISNKMIKFLDIMFEEVFGKLSDNSDIMMPISKVPYKMMKDNITDVVKVMNAKGFNYVLILDENKKLVGIFSDISLQKIYLNGGNKKKLESVKEYLKVPKKYIKFAIEEELSEESIKLITEEDIELIIVTDNGKSTGKVVGIITEKEIEKIVE